MLPRVAYVTYRGDLPDHDLPFALDALREAHLDAEAVAWDDDVVDWADFDLVVVRSTWDYAPRRPEFLKWARSVEAQTRLANPVRCLVKNTDKSYLREFAQHAIPTIETAWFEPGDDEIQFAEHLAALGWSRFVVKPNIGNGVFTAVPMDTAASAARAAADLAGNGLLALVQPYLSVVERHAELSVIALGGRVSHAVMRAPVGGQISQVAVPDEAAETVRAVLDLCRDDGPLLYARVDLIPGTDGWLVMEFEATEPRLFLDVVPGAAQRFARAVRAVVNAGESGS